MTTATDVLADAFGRIQETVHETVDGLPPKLLNKQPKTGANSIAWLVWHLTRVQDDHVAGVAGSEQVWTADGWADRFGLPFAAADIGFGHSPADVAAVRVDSAELLTGYHDAVHDRTAAYLSTLKAADLDRVVDRAWTPPVTLSVRLVSVVGDDLQHIGQAAYLRGLLERG